MTKKTVQKMGAKNYYKYSINLFLIVKTTIKIVICVVKMLTFCVVISQSHSRHPQCLYFCPLEILPLPSIKVFFPLKLKQCFLKQQLKQCFLTWPSFLLLLVLPSHWECLNFVQFKHRYQYLLSKHYQPQKILNYIYSMDL